MTTQQLIPTHTGELAGTSQPLVNARDLHLFLQSGWKFSDWIEKRIADYGFTEGQDFFRSSGKSLLGRPKTEYHLSLDMAKELAMVEKSARGRQARQYFIACENRLRELALAEDARLDILEARIEQRLNTLEAELLAADPRLDKVRRCKLAGLSDLETSRALQIGESSVRRTVQRLRRLGLLPDTGGASTTRQLDLLPGGVA